MLGVEEMFLAPNGVDKIGLNVSFFGASSCGELNRMSLEDSCVMEPTESVRYVLSRDLLSVLFLGAENVNLLVNDCNCPGVLQKIFPLKFTLPGVFNKSWKLGFRDAVKYDNPKSVNLTWPLLESNRLSGLISR